MLDQQNIETHRNLLLLLYPVYKHLVPSCLTFWRMLKKMKDDPLQVYIVNMNICDSFQHKLHLQLDQWTSLENLFSCVDHLDSQFAWRTGPLHNLSHSCEPKVGIWLNLGLVFTYCAMHGKVMETNFSCVASCQIIRFVIVSWLGNPSRIDTYTLIKNGWTKNPIWFHLFSTI